MNGNVLKVERGGLKSGALLNGKNGAGAHGNIETPLRIDAFELSDEEKIQKISFHFKEIMNTLGLDLQDDSLQNSPARVAKMFVQEVFSGLKPDNKPDITLFENKFSYNEMLIEKNINLYSYCEHHFVPIIGKVHVGYISNGYVIGLSKINRIVQYFGKRPQVQERLTKQIGEELCKVLKTDDVAVLVEAKHLCVSMRGVRDEHSDTTTTFYSGIFHDPQQKAEFLAYLPKP